jgi:N-acetylglucosaminyl-diphospho-decaprenol L-rhamnosyltransferase
MIARLIVSYNSAQALRDYAAIPLPGVETLVVDNASRDNTLEVAAGLGFRVLALPLNHGFGGAIMQGLAALEHDLVFIANPDLAIGEEALAHLVDAAARYPEADLFVPSIRKGDGSLFFRHESLFEPRARHRQPPDGEACIHTISGAAMLVRRASFVQHGFDPEIFLYFEDDDLSIGYAKARRPIIYVPQAQVMHGADKSSTPSRATDRLKNLSFGWSWGYVMRKHAIGDPARTAQHLLWRVLRAALTLRFARARRHWEVRAGLMRFLAGQRAPFRPLPAAPSA